MHRNLSVGVEEVGIGELCRQLLSNQWFDMAYRTSYSVRSLNIHKTKSPRHCCRGLIYNQASCLLLVYLINIIFLVEMKLPA